MNIRRLVLFSLITLLGLAFPRPAMADGFQDGQVVFGGSYTLTSGETLNGDLVVFGGMATVEEGATVNGNLGVVGGNAEVNGYVNGDVAVMGGVVYLGPQAVVSGDVVTMGGSLQRAEGAQILGQVVEGGSGPISLPNGINIPVPWLQQVRLNVSLWWRALWMLFRAFMLAALAMLSVLFLERPTQRVAQAATQQPLTTGAAGLLMLVITPGTLLLLAITLILLPVALALALLLAVAALFGWLALGTEVGTRLMKAFHQDWPLAAQAGLGTFVLSFVTGGLNFIPCVGWVPGFLALIVGLGAVALTRLGTVAYPAPVAAPVLLAAASEEGDA